MRALAATAAILLTLPAPAAPEPPGCGTRPGLERELAGLHAVEGARRHGWVHAASAADRDAGDVAVLQDRGDLVIRRNPFDLDGAAVRLTPRSGGGYDVARVAIPLEPPGTAIPLGPGEARAVDLGFAFPFFGASRREAFVHADGHLTFDSPDTTPGEPGLGRVISGPPRIAPFFTALDPSRGGSVSVRLEPGRAVVLWSGIPGAAQINRNTFAVALHESGAIDLVWGTLQTREAVVAVVPGGSAPAPVDWSAPATAGSPSGLVERFSETERLDLVAAVRRFLSGHPDAFQQVVVYTARALNPVPGTLAFEINVRNDVRGIGLDVLDHAAEWGSAGALESVVYMDAIDTYATVDGFEFLGHEVGHRWLARLALPSLLGRGGTHWSFFLDTDASVMEGNAIAERAPGRFETVDFARRFSALDQYAMGLRAAAEVPPFFYVDVPDDFRPNRPFKADSAPEAGVTFTGVRRDVRIEDVVRALGPRVPAVGPTVFRQAFVLVEDDAAAATDVRLRAVERIRARFGPWFVAATDGRGAALSTLR